VGWEQPDVQQMGVYVQAWSLDPPRKYTDPMRMNGYQQRFQNRPDLRVIEFKGRPVGLATWESLGQDGDAFGVYGRRFELLEP